MRRNKYGAVKSQCVLGHMHASKLERNYCDQLRMLKKNGDILAYEIQVKYPLIVFGKLISNHIVDFVVFNKDGSVQAHECKGYETRLWKIKKNLFEALFPAIKYVVVK